MLVALLRSVKISFQSALVGRVKISAQAAFCLIQFLGRICKPVMKISFQFALIGRVKFLDQAAFCLISLFGRI